jgi:hypothetical protein
MRSRLTGTTESGQSAEAFITYFPLARLADFHVGRQDRFGVLALYVDASHGGERLEILFPSDHERAVSEAMEQMRSLKTRETGAAIAA